VDFGKASWPQQHQSMIYVRISDRALHAAIGDKSGRIKNCEIQTMRQIF